MRRLLKLIIRSYQVAISPFLGSHCRFYPCCSQYAIEALDQHGLVQGSWLTIKRLGRCHPLCEGGVDPVPESGHKLTTTK
jgi:uncharacterized protein